MQKIVFKLISVLLLLPVIQAQAAICPDPMNSSLQQGIIPPPWELDPFSESKRIGDQATRCGRANIFVAGYGRGVICSYQSSLGSYSIWWQVGVKAPASVENNWHESLGGYECNTTFDACVFYP